MTSLAEDLSLTKVLPKAPLWRYSNLRGYIPCPMYRGNQYKLYIYAKFGADTRYCKVTYDHSTYNQGDKLRQCMRQLKEHSGLSRDNLIQVERCIMKVFLGANLANFKVDFEHTISYMDEYQTIINVYNDDYGHVGSTVVAKVFLYPGFWGPPKDKWDGRRYLDEEYPMKTRSRIGEVESE